MTRNEEKANVLAEHLGIKNGIIVNSGTIALLSALKVANIKPGDNVLINGYCCYSLFEAIMNVGANPIFVIPKDFYNISVDEIRKILNENEIKCLIATHQYGIVQEIKAIKEEFPELIIIEDIAQAWNIQEKKLDVVIFNSSKNINLSGIDIKKIKNNNIVCVGIPKYKKILNDKKTSETIVPIIAPDSSTNLGKELGIEDKNIKFVVKVISNSAPVSKELLKSGIGIGYINEEIVRDEIEKGNLCIISSKTTADIYSVNVAMQNKNNNFVIKEFIKCLKGVLTEND